VTDDPVFGPQLRRPNAYNSSEVLYAQTGSADDLVSLLFGVARPVCENTVHFTFQEERPRDSGDNELGQDAAQEVAWQEED